jgi:hypothetical protein
MKQRSIWQDATLDAKPGRAPAIVSRVDDDGVAHLSFEFKIAGGEMLDEHGRRLTYKPGDRLAFRLHCSDDGQITSAIVLAGRQTAKRGRIGQAQPAPRLRLEEDRS